MRNDFARLRRSIALLCVLMGVLTTLPLSAASVVGGPMRNFKTKMEASIAQTDSRTLITVPRMSMTFELKEPGALLLQYCSESQVELAGARILVRLRVDSKVSGSMYLSGDTEMSSRCVQWAFSDLEAGSHTMKVEYASSDGSVVTQYYRSLNVGFFK